MKRKLNTFSRFNQPKPCRMCGKGTTWSDSNGYCGLGLCKPCYELATMDNEHYDGYHADAPNAACRLCQGVK
jgi:hypothetical protein